MAELGNSVADSSVPVLTLGQFADTFGDWMEREIEAVLAGGPAVPATSRTTWPCIRFSIPRVSWTGPSVQGEIFRDEKTSILEFCIVGMFRVYEPRRVQIPLDEVLTISCHSSGWRKMEIFLKAHHLAALAELPAGRQGKGRLQINWDDREAAQQLVDSIVHRPLPQPAGQLPGRASQVIDPDRIRRQLLAPAVGLLLTAVVALVSTLMLAVVLARRFDPAGDVLAKCLVGAVAFVLMPLGVWLMVAGALHMLRQHSYPVCVAAALVALLPWSPAWVLGLPVGIGALVILGRPEVIRAFLRNREGATPGPSGSPKPPGLVVNKLRAWFRSIVKYFVTIPGRRTQERDARKPRRTPE